MASFSEETASATEEEPTETPVSHKREARLRKFRELHFKRNEARKLNHQEVVEEDKRLKLPANWEAKKARLEWELAEDQKKKECAERGEEYNRVKLLEITADDAERWERKKKKKNPDTGFAGYAEAQFRQYQRLTKQIRPDLESYERQREECGEDFYPTSNSLIHGTHVPTKEGIDRMVEDVEKQIEKRAKYSRRSELTTTTQTSTTSTKGTPSSTRRRSASTQIYSGDQTELGERHGRLVGPVASCGHVQFFSSFRSLALSVFSVLWECF
ncbi:pre-mRNA-splicing factor SYF2 [Lates japonicus]|uniref:Pre-mRNA-splicing factor SYF2 n=1 Tax=Lates japonicus TaxID=270547 RepID=A0AAD3MM01_LATJO|nr:pre-mRNA-splicing factor SYF2 [Lates japonicus]